MTTLTMAGKATEMFIDNDIPVFLWGPPGVGKSQKVAQIAKKRNWNLIDFRAVLRDPVDLRGVPVPNMKTKTTEWFVPSELPNEERHGKHGIFFMDELNVANPQVQASCFGLVLDRKLGDYVMPEGWRIVAAGNRQSDRSSAQRLSRALANRFGHFEVEADAKTWINDYAVYHCNPLVYSFIDFRPELIHKMDVEDERKFPSPRQWTEVSKICEAPDDMRFTSVEALVGQMAAGEFEGYVRTFRELPDLNEILKNPKKGPVPTDPSALYAISSALAYRANRDNFENVLTYAQRLPADYEVVVGIDATKRDPMLARTKAYIKFIERNKHIQLGSFKLAS